MNNIIRNKNKNKIIIGKININKDDINKDIQIINSYENYQKAYPDDKFEDEYKNEKEIKENIEIRINEKKLNLHIIINFKKKENIKLNIYLKII